MKKYLFLLLLCVMLLFSMTSCAADKIEWQDLTWPVGAPIPDAEAFAKELPNGVSVRYAKEYHFSSVGDYELELVVSGAMGGESRVKVNFSLVVDKEPPVIKGMKELTAYVGEGVSYKEGVTLTDNCDGEITLSVDTSHVNLRAEGSYPVYYTAVDVAGNCASFEAILYVYSAEVSEEMLYQLLDPIIAERIPTTLSNEQKVREVYSYVYYSISYSSYSDKSDWVRAAYDGLRTGTGDCFTYFALSKAFFERLGFDNMEIQRTVGLTDERHYWNYVNIGTEKDPLWYHFDATQLRGVQHSGCLLTDKQVDAYTGVREDENGVKNYFYAYDKSAYPASATEIITSTPTLEPYY